MFNQPDCPWQVTSARTHLNMLLRGQQKFLLLLPARHCLLQFLLLGIVRPLFRSAHRHHSINSVAHRCRECSLGVDNPAPRPARPGPGSCLVSVRLHTSWALRGTSSGPFQSLRYIQTGHSARNKITSPPREKSLSKETRASLFGRPMHVQGSAPNK